MGLFGGTRIKTIMAEFSAECHRVGIVVVIDSNKIEVIVSDDQKRKKLEE